MEVIITKEKEFKDLIYVIRGQQVMLDSDLAELYGYEVKNLNKQVSRNIEKFPEDFRFQLTMEETKKLPKFQFGTLNNNQNKRGQNIKKLPYVFTEIGVYMLATVLNGKVATEQSMYIMRSFKEMKHYLVENQSLLNNAELLKLSNTVMQNKEDIYNIENKIETLATKDDINKIMENFIDETKIKEKVFLNGQVFDAMEAYICIYKQAKKSIYIIDDYINIDTLSLLKHKNELVQIIVFSDNKGKGKHQLHSKEVLDFDSQYPTLEVKKNHGICHDRYIIIDYDTENEMVYHCGASSKDAGKKVCSINMIENTEIFHTLMMRLFA